MSGGADELVEGFRSELEMLEENSKPVITSLTMIAEESDRSLAPFIVSAIESRILSVDAERRLPVLYLMDSIVKNVGGVYLELFARNAAFLFGDTFARAGPATRAALLRLLRTWHGVFPSEVVATVEQSLPPPPQPPPQPQPPQSYYGGLPPPMQLQLQLQQQQAPFSLPPHLLADARAIVAGMQQQQQQQLPQQPAHSEAVWKLYGAFRTQCSTCGMRFRDVEAMARHMDWHYATTRAAATAAAGKSSGRSLSRSWLLPKSEWVRQQTSDQVEVDTMQALKGGEGKAATDAPQEGRSSSSSSESGAAVPSAGGRLEVGSENGVHTVPADDNRKECAVCGEQFDQFWSSDAEEWLFRDVVEDKATHRYMHFKCSLSERGKLLTPQLARPTSRLLVQPTLVAAKSEPVDASQEPPPAKRPKQEEAEPTAATASAITPS